MKHSTLGAAAISLSGLAAMAAPRIANACAVCGLGDDDPARHAYNASAIFMLAGPYVTFGAIAGILYLAYRRSARREKLARISQTVTGIGQPQPR